MNRHTKCKLTLGVVHMSKGLGASGWSCESQWFLILCWCSAGWPRVPIISTYLILDIVPWTLAMSSATSGSNTQFVVVVQQMVLCRLYNRKGMCDWPGQQHIYLTSSGRVCCQQAYLDFQIDGLVEFEWHFETVAFSRCSYHSSKMEGGLPSLGSTCLVQISFQVEGQNHQLSNNL